MDRPVCSTGLAHSFACLKSTCRPQQNVRGLPVLDETARSSSDLSDQSLIWSVYSSEQSVYRSSEEASMAEADHMIWDLLGYFAQLQHCDQKC